MQGEVQVTVIRIDNYGPWTTSLGSDREHLLQILQANLHSELQRLFSERRGLVFNNKYDELIAITNGIDIEGHREIQRHINDKHHVTISMSVGIGRTPYEAQHQASQHFTEVLGLKANSVRGLLLAVATLPLEDSLAKIAHMDVNDSTTFMHKDALSLYEGSVTLYKLYLRLAESFIRSGGLVFYCGGDNFMAVCNGMDTESLAEKLRLAPLEFKLSLKSGVGIAKTARRAAELATLSLDMIRSHKAEGPIYCVSDI